MERERADMKKTLQYVSLWRLSCLPYTIFFLLLAILSLLRLLLSYFSSWYWICRKLNSIHSSLCSFFSLLIRDMCEYCFILACKLMNLNLQIWRISFAKWLFIFDVSGICRILYRFNLSANVCFFSRIGFSDMMFDEMYGS